MDSLDQTVGRIKEIITKADSGASGNVEAAVRELAKAALSRNDLRLPAEMLFSDINNSFLGFNRFDKETKAIILEESVDKLARLEELVRQGQAIKEIASKLPPPPDYVIREVEAEKRRQQQEQAELDAKRRKREREKRERMQKDKRRKEQKRRGQAKERSREVQPSIAKSESKKDVGKEPTTDRKSAGRDKGRVDKGRMAEKMTAKTGKVPKSVNKSEKPNGNKIADKRQHSTKPPAGSLDSPLTAVPGIGSILSGKFEIKNVFTVRDLLTYLPRDYEDRREIVTIDKLEQGSWFSSVVKVERVSLKKLPGKKGNIIVVKVTDSTGVACCKFFGGRLPAIKNQFPVGRNVLVTGEVAMFRNMLEFHHPVSQIVEEGQKANGSIVPVYSETEGLSRRRIMGFVRTALDTFSSVIDEPIPAKVRANQKILPIVDALEMVHFPQPDTDFDLLKIQATKGHRRLVFEELFLLQLGIAIRRNAMESSKGFVFSGNATVLKKLNEILPFDLTEAQKNAVNKIIGDMRKPVPMKRLLQGDVGSGKTVVALFAIVNAVQDGFQAAMMAPTEILAAQHYKTIKPIMEKLGFSCVLITGNVDGGDNAKTLKEILSGKTSLVIGTHALISERVKFTKLGLAIVDEQHRFGVGQRKRLSGKGALPDVLTMTATPIPRTLAMTAFGDLDISVIDEKPAGRKPVRTELFTGEGKNRAYAGMKDIIKKGGQGFIVFPVVEKGSKTGLLDATSQAERLSADEFANFKVGLIHGKMKPVEKEETIKAFSEGRLDLLVATTIIEVGLDVPKASGIIIEHAERFGLSQLHQMRGRVGRSSEQGWCFAISYAKDNELSQNRLTAFRDTDDGLALAEKDLSFRGEGDLLGNRQHGMPLLRIADLTRDLAVLEEAKKEAGDLLKHDPHLTKTDESQAAKKALERWWGSDFSQETAD